MNPPPPAEYFAHIRADTEPNAANFNYSLSTCLTPQAGLENPTQEMTKSQQSSWGFPAEKIASHPWDSQRERIKC